MRNHLLTKNYTAEGAIGAWRIVKFGAADGNVLQAAAATDKLVGVKDALPASGAGDRSGDVARAGIAEVEYGGAVAAGDALTSDADGRAVVAAPEAGSKVRVIGVAEVAGVAGDIGSLLIAPGVLQG